MDIKHKNISSQSAKVLAHFSFLNQPAFVMQEAVELLRESSREAIKKLMGDMINRGLLLRLKDGVYWIIPYERDTASYFPNHHLVAKYLVNNANYYIGFTAHWRYTKKIAPEVSGFCITANEPIAAVRIFHFNLISRLRAAKIMTF